MKGVGWEADGSLDVAQAKKAVELASDVSQFACGGKIFLMSFTHFLHYNSFSQQKYRQKVDSVKFTQAADTLSIKHAKKSQELQSDVRYLCRLVLSDFMLTFLIKQLTE